MGQESSSPIDDSVAPVTLKARTLDALAEYIKSGKVKRVVVMVSDSEGLKSMSTFRVLSLVAGREPYVSQARA